MSITKLLTIPSGASRIGSSCYTFPDRQNVFFQSGAGDFPQFGDREFLLFIEFNNLTNNSTHRLFTVHLNASNFFRVGNRVTNSDILVEWTIGGTARVCRFRFSQAELLRFSGSILFFVRRVGNTLDCGILDGESGEIVIGDNNDGIDNNTLSSSFTWDAIDGGTAIIGYNGLGTGTAANLTRPYIGSGAHLCVAPIGKTLATVDRVGGGDAGVTNDDLIRMLRDKQRINDFVWDTDESASYGDLCNSEGMRYQPATTRTILNGDRLICPRTGFEMTAVITSGTVTQHPDYTTPSSRPSVWQAESSRPIIVPIAGGALEGYTDRGPSQANIHTYIRRLGLDGRPAAWPIPTRLPFAFIDSGDSNSRGVRFTALGSTFPGIDHHFDVPIALIGDSAMSIPSGHGATFSDWPNAGDTSWLHFVMMRHTDNDPLTVPIFGEDATGAPAIPWGSAHSGNESAYNHHAHAYCTTCTFHFDGHDYVCIYVRHRGTGNGYGGAYLYREDGQWQYQQIEQTINSSSNANAAITQGVVYLGNGFLALMGSVRAESGGYYATVCYLVDVRDFTNKSKWFAPLTGEVLDGSGANSLELATSSVITSNDHFNLYVENNGKIEAERDSPVGRKPIGRDGSIAQIIVVQEDTDKLSSDPTNAVIDVELRVWSFDGAKLTQAGKVSLIDHFETHHADESDLQYMQVREALQFVGPQNQAVLAYAVNGEHDLSGLTLPFEPRRWGGEIHALYWQDIINSPQTFTYLGKIYDIAEDGGLAVRPQRVGDPHHHSTSVIVYRLAEDGPASGTGGACDPVFVFVESAATPPGVTPLGNQWHPGVWHEGVWHPGVRHTGSGGPA